MPPGAIRTSGGIHQETGGNVMSQSDAFNRILASLRDAMLDDTHWAATAALIDDALRATGNGLVVGEGAGDEVRIFFAGMYLRGQRRQDLERQYFDLYYPVDERLPCLRQLADSRLVHVSDLFSDAELKTSAVYNEWLQHCGARNGLNTRLDGPHGSRILWTLGDPLAGSGWGSAHIDMMQGLLPHIRKEVPYFVARGLTKTITEAEPGCALHVGRPVVGTVTVLDNDTPPSVPYDLAATPGNTEVRVWWEPPLEDHGQPTAAVSIQRVGAGGG